MDLLKLLACGALGGGVTIPAWVPVADGVAAIRSADFTTEGLTNHYFAAGAARANAAAYHTAINATFGRTSAAYRWTAAGLHASMGSGVLRHDHDAATFAPIGIRLEGARTNECLRSQDITAAAWTVFSTGFTRTADAGIGPDGTTTADRFQAVGAADGGGLNQNVPLSGGSSAKTVTVSFIGKSYPGADQTFRQKNTHSAVLDNFSSNRTATSAWQKFAFTITNAASAGNGNQTIGILPVNGGGSFDLLAEHFQMEQAAFASSAIPTAAGTATRDADSLIATRGSPSIISKRISAITAPGTGAQVLWQIDDGTAANRILVWRNTSNEIHVTAVISSSNVADLNLGIVNADTAIKVAFRAAQDNFAACLNGGSLVTDTSGNMPAGLVNERWGADSNGNQWFGTIKDDAEWNIALTNSALQAA